TVQSLPPSAIPQRSPRSGYRERETMASVERSLLRSDSLPPAASAANCALQEPHGDAGEAIGLRLNLVADQVRHSTSSAGSGSRPFRRGDEKAQRLRMRLQSSTIGLKPPQNMRLP